MSTMSSFEEVMQRIHTEISIKNEDREMYTKDFDTICKWLMDELKKNCSVFKSIYNGLALFGSYAENLRIGKPDEFDVHFQLKLPFHEQMLLEQTYTGSVSVNVKNVLLHLKYDSNSKDRFHFLQNLCYNGTTILSGEKLQDWFEIKFQEIFNNKPIRITGNGFNYELSYHKCLTAHTIEAVSKNSNRKLDIDLVPAFRFESKNQTAKIFNRQLANNKKPDIWYVVPKPKKGGYASFSVSAPEAEIDILWARYNLKGSMRLLKSLRDNTPCWYIKSYFIRTCYLNECEKKSIEFWQKPYGYLLIHMIHVLLQGLRKNFIPCYWNPDYNILDDLSPAKLKEAIDEFEGIVQELETFLKNYRVSYAEVRKLFDDPASC